MRTAATRLAFIDALKAIASQLIVLHHLAFYGPMSDVARELAPALFSWLSQDARIAVQVFLVIGGFLAAKALAPAGKLISTAPLTLLKNRYLKLIIPYLAAVLLSILCAAIARSLIEHDSIPNPPTPWQVLAHIALLQNILDVDSLSAGVWYIAIDFQLFTLLLGTLWLARSSGKEGIATQRLGTLLVSGLALVSLLYFNRDSHWDNWALYFFGAYALGALSYWLTETEKNPYCLPFMTVIVVAVLLIDFRSRIAVALLTALALGISRRSGFMGSWPKGKVLAYLGKISYSVFLAHFPVVLVVNAIFSKITPESAVANAFGIVLAWAVSIAVGAAFFHWIESRASYWQGLTIDPVLRVLERFVLVFRTR
ncbi:acyltransferase [Propionivibrio sp.]|uniref:acyltransferase family protein n=1 Tax=Propionivibrio sp. TaxID=2212460 RepID=UPI002639FFCA|nr:acyltransferase [Propionivibrio sp.]